MPRAAEASSTGAGANYAPIPTTPETSLQTEYQLQPEVVLVPVSVRLQCLLAKKR